MESMNDQQARAYVAQWLSTHPDRLHNRRHDPMQLRNWEDAAVLRLRNGIAEDAEFILRRFATKTETHSME
ncbi:hypothetical protein [Hymenobacter jeollabukensis]|uniref:Uncharacterized protein n=1 Tax=Hymenobacter jeollabukensis TaxID=2025313 RepID=A0A5R8WXV1_9BACT|nr:hypothetical protein [Hymenobacter jeollabukensis]TLM96883.1 hypothetical protein FDY95_02505 [Hymenobacter jeollabukensis]